MQKITEELLDSIEDYQHAFERSVRIFNGDEVCNVIIPYSIFEIPILNRAMSLNEGFLTLTKENNYFCAIPMIRMQVDNCILSYAGSLASDFDDFLHHLSCGKQIHKYKNPDNNISFFESKILEKLDNDFQGIKAIYQFSSKFVHLTSRHYTGTLVFSKEGDKVNLDIRTGKYDSNFTELDKQNLYNIMMKVNDILFNITVFWLKGYFQDYRTRIPWDPNSLIPNNKTEI